MQTESAATTTAHTCPRCGATADAAQAPADRLAALVACLAESARTARR